MPEAKTPRTGPHKHYTAPKCTQAVGETQYLVSKAGHCTSWEEAKEPTTPPKDAQKVNRVRSSSIP